VRRAAWGIPRTVWHVTRTSGWNNPCRQGPMQRRRAMLFIYHSTIACPAQLPTPMPPGQFVGEWRGPTRRLPHPSCSHVVLAAGRCLSVAALQRICGHERSPKSPHANDSRHDDASRTRHLAHVCSLRSANAPALRPRTGFERDAVTTVAIKSYSTPHQQVRICLTIPCGLVH
jgi:hypothetical protein